MKIITVHSAKGLEFKYVFLVNMVDKKFPVIERRDQIELPKELIKEIIPEGDIHLQEERRLCYVAMTRAKKGLFFTSADDYGGARKKKLSRFLIEMGFDKEKKNQEEQRIDKEILSKKDKAVFNLKEGGGKGDKIKAPNHFSFSQLAAFKKCPLQYKFAYIIGVPVKGKAVFTFGKTIHKVLYEFVKMFVENNNIKQASLFGRKKSGEKNKAARLEDLFEIYDQVWLDEWYENRTQKEKYYKLGKKALKNFYNQFLENPPKILKINNELALEMPFKLKIGNDLLIGRIDRIDDLGNGVRIIDYKTGSSKEKLSLEDKEQLLIYQIAAEKALGLKPLELKYYYLEEGKEVSFLGSEKEKERVMSSIISEIENIKKSDFLPTPGWHCKFCDFRDICEHRSF